MVGSLPISRERPVNTSIAAVPTRDAQGKPIAGLYHGVQILTAADVIRGRRIFGHPACSPEIRLAGATYVELPMDKVATDGPFVSAPAWPVLPRFLAAFLEVLDDKVGHAA
jgi:deglycase